MTPKLQPRPAVLVGVLLFLLLPPPGVRAPPHAAASGGRGPLEVPHRIRAAAAGAPELCPRAGPTRRLLWDPFAYLDLSEDRGLKAAHLGPRAPDLEAGRTLRSCRRVEEARI